MEGYMGEATDAQERHKQAYWRATASKFLGSNGSHLDTATEHYVRHGLYLAVHHVFLGLIIVSASTVAVLILTPRHFEKRRF
jgi:hypothetical protein